jgi:glutamate-ammonia-ligase adenylyltransferase
MDALASRFVEGLRRGTPEPELLARVGEPDPAAAVRAFSRACADPDLAASCESWATALLRTARPGFAAHALADLARCARDVGVRLEPARAAALPLVLGSSNFLARLLQRRPEWIDDLAGDPAPPDACPTGADWIGIRRAKYRGLLRVAARDLLGRPFEESLRELSDLADGCLAAALDRAACETGAEAPALLALGKLGGRELNFSSDVDLLFVYAVPPGRDDLTRNESVSRLVRQLKGGLERPGDEGFAYRVDLDLRPEGRAGVLANSVDAALAYYESFGAEWERQMLIRLRPVAGPGDAARAFADELVPFVYRRLVDPGVMRDVREMKTRIEQERRGAGRDLEADLKEGPGGIRDVEFLVQSFQLLLGGREPALRNGNVLEALGVLGSLGLLPEETASALRSAYTWLRRAEHALQLVEEKQTARFPRDRAGQLGLARRMGYADETGDAACDRLLDDWTAVRSEVRSHFEALVLREPR